jgi:predicted AlkP superfamily pyrophosphatase or phosphodiesterase
MLPLVALALAVATPRQEGQSRIGIAPPKLVVLISIDQFRGDYIERYNRYFLPAKSGATLGGFKYLMETGADFRNAAHNHIPTATGPGHATLMSGSEPAFDGIVGNEWFNRKTGKSMYCVSDPLVETVGGTAAPMSPRNLLVTTVGDELKMATNGKSRVVGVAIKDRAAILMAGHAADTVIWLDYNLGKWITSTWFAPNKQLPAWVDALNGEKNIDKLAGKTWIPLLPADDYAVTRTAPSEQPGPNGQPFLHPMEPQPGSKLYNGFITSPFGNDITLQAAERAIDAEKLGQRDVPDILVINLSSNDYVGHRFGPNSPEVMDMTVNTDRQLSRFINKLQHTIPGGMDNVALVVTGDHGVLPIPEEANDVYKTGAIRGVATAAVTAVKKALNAKYGEGAWVMGSGLYEQNLYLNRGLAAEKGLSMSDVERTAADAADAVPGVFAAYTRTQILANGLPTYAWRDRVLNGLNAKLGGDILVLEAPGDYAFDGTGTGHQAVWDYDAHVPILLHARGIKPGTYLKRVFTSGIAPTLCKLLGIESPTGNVGEPLVDNLER